HPGRGFGATDQVGIRAGGDFPTLVRECSEVAVAVGAESKTVTRFRPVGRGGKALTARDDELNWTVKPLGRKSHQRRARCHRTLRPERPADILTDDAYVCRVHPEGLGDAPSEHVDGLAWLEDGQLLAFPEARGRKQLYRIEVLCWRRAFDVDGHVGTGQGRLSIPDRRIFPMAL